MQLQNMECTPAKGCKLNIEWKIFPEWAIDRPIVPERAKSAGTEVSRLRGSVNFGTSYVPDSHPTPLLCSFCVSSFLVVFGRSFVFVGGARFACSIAFM